MLVFAYRRVTLLLPILSFLASAVQGQVVADTEPPPSLQVTVFVRNANPQVGSTTVLQCSAPGHTEMVSYSWTRRSGLPIPSSRSFELDQGRQLYIYDHIVEDSDVYVCTATATSMTGSAEVTLSIGGQETIIPPSRQSTRPPIIRPTTRRLTTQPPTHAPMTKTILTEPPATASRTAPSTEPPTTAISSAPPLPTAFPTTEPPTQAPTKESPVTQVPTRKETLQPQTRTPRGQPTPLVPVGVLRISVSPSEIIRRPGNSTFLVCSTTLPAGYEVISTRWSRLSGLLLPERSRLYTCNTNLYVFDHQLSDSDTYTCAVEASHPGGGWLVGEGRARIQVVDIRVVVTPAASSKSPGESVEFACSVFGSPEASVSYKWNRQGGRPIPLLSQERNGLLQLLSLRRKDTGRYCCVATVGRETNRAESCAELLVGDGCIKDGNFLAKGEYQYFNTSAVIRQAQVRPAADVVFLVDESASMVNEHAWLQDISHGLDEALQSQGIGVDIPNQFGLVGFAKDDVVDLKGRPILMKSCQGALMGTAQEFNEARTQLALNGRIEDGYLAINLALDRYPFRPGQACQIILVTDEGRTQLEPPEGGDPLSFQYILDKMQRRGCVLNVVVNEQMAAHEGNVPTRALGVSYNNDSAVETSAGNFRLIRGKGYPIALSGHGNTDKDYTRLAFALRGAAWDLNRLRLGGDTGKAFTKAFISLKVREISKQLCERCHCDVSPRPDCRAGCTGEAPVVMVVGTTRVNAGGRVSLECTFAAGDPIPRLEWKLTDPLPDGAVMDMRGDSPRLEIPLILDKFCIDCVGTNLEGEETVSHCVDVLREEPTIAFGGSNKGPFVEYGESVQLECVKTGGTPQPQLSWTTVSQVEYKVHDRANVSVLTVEQLTESVCFDCVATNIVGTTTLRQCINVQQERPRVTITASNGDHPVLFGQQVELTCMILQGIPQPEIFWEGSLPEGNTIRDNKDTTRLIIPQLQERFCVNCVGSNAVGRTVDRKCIEVLKSSPVVGINSTNGAEPVLRGGRVTLECSIIRGVPQPDLVWAAAGGGPLPSSVNVRQKGSSLLLEVTGLDQHLCVECIGSNGVGNGKATHCVELKEVLPEVVLLGGARRPPIPKGGSVTLECTPGAQTQVDTIQWEVVGGGPLPGKVDSTAVSTVLTIERLMEPVCVACVGTNIAGQGRQRICLELKDEPPVIIIQGSNKGLSLNEGGDVDLLCTPAEGVPTPAVRWDVLNDVSISNVRRRNIGNGSLLAIRNIQQSMCVECVAANLVGRASQRVCLDVLKSCSGLMQGNTKEVLHGSASRNFSTAPGNTIIRLPSSAVVAFVIDESRSMRTEHNWLKSTVPSLEKNLMERGIGVQRPNQYALVGFGHLDRSDPQREKGAVLYGSPACGTATDIQEALEGLYTDGSKEDGYSAISVSLQQVACLQRPRPPNTACQVILATDEGRDVLTDWHFQTMLNELRRYDCIINVAVNERMKGGHSRDEDTWSKALGVSGNGQAVIADGQDSFEVTQFGRAFALSGHEDTHQAYVELASQTGGAAWDLNMLRTDRFRQSFTKAFIEVKIQEIERQIIGLCDECVCTNGRWSCTRVPGIGGEQACLNPASNPDLAVVASPKLVSTRVGDSVEFVCSAVARDNANTTTVWSPHTVRTVILDGKLLLTNVTARDQGIYTCQARNSGGYRETTVELSIGTPISTPQPQQTSSPLPITSEHTTTGEPLFILQLPDAKMEVGASKYRVVLEEESLELTCCARGRYQSQVAWYKNSNNEEQLPEGVVPSGGRLLFPVLRREHAGEYECVYSNAAGAESALAQITVQGPFALIIASATCR